VTKSVVVWAEEGRAEVDIGEMRWTVFAEPRPDYGWVWFRIRMPRPFVVDGITYWARGLHIARPMISLEGTGGSSARMWCNNPPDDHEIDAWVRGADVNIF
jgi:hypothetical protein